VKERAVTHLGITASIVIFGFGTRVLGYKVTTLCDGFLALGRLGGFGYFHRYAGDDVKRMVVENDQVVNFCSQLELV
jgi:hypothetical protein